MRSAHIGILPVCRGGVRWGSDFKEAISTTTYTQGYDKTSMPNVTAVGVLQSKGEIHTHPKYTVQVVNVEKPIRENV